MPEITVGVTTYNLEKYIKNCIEGLLKQTFQSFEILVYDDCSTDNTRTILKELQDKFQGRITLLFGDFPLKSPAKARNAILNSGQIHGKYIAFLDGDDRLEDCYLEELYAVAQISGAEITLCAYDRVEEGSGHILSREMRGFPEVIQFPPKGDILAFLNGSLWNKLILVSCIEDIRLPEFRVGEDLTFQTALFEKCSRIACVDKILIHYLVRRTSVISNTQEETIYRFAEEFLRQWSRTTKTWLRETLELMAFIHIGISMPLRAKDNPNIKMKTLLQWITMYFEKNYHWFRGNSMFRFNMLSQHGMRGIGLWTAKVCYRLHVFSVFLWLYSFITNILHIEVKF